MKALIDGDVLVYKCGFASEDRIYKVISEGGVLAELSYKKEVDEFIDTFLGGTEYEVVKETIPHPIEFALGNVKQSLHTIINNTRANSYQIYLTGEGNFREELAVTLPYKGNRSSVKPHHYGAIRDYLIKSWGAIVVPYQEADDALGIAQMNEEGTIICTIDKDLDMIPGLHYNFDSQEVYSIDYEQGIRNFYMQLITGDRVDNIQGIPGCGKKKAEATLDGLTSEEELYSATLALYKSKGLEYWDLWENAQLLWIRRSEGQYWEPPNVGERSEEEGRGLQAGLEATISQPVLVGTKAEVSQVQEL